MRLLILLLLMTVLFASCGNSGVPPDIIPRDRMETIMWQLMQSDEYVNTLVAKDSSKKSSTERMKIYQQVFDLNKTSMSEFKKSYQFYMEHPDITKIIFDSITAKASRQRIELYKPKPDMLKPRARADSLKIKRDSISLQQGKLTLKPDTTKLKPHKNKLRRPKKRVKSRSV
jgi:Domain of unknown function (DUF4296)